MNVQRSAVRRRRTWVGVILTALVLSLGTGQQAWAQRAQDPDDKEEAKIATPDKAKLQTERATLKNEQKGPEAIKSEQFSSNKSFESLKKTDESIVRLKKLIEITPKDHKDRPEFLFNLADQYWAKSKYYEAQAFKKQDECYALADRKEEAKVKGCERDMKEMLAEGKRLREQTVELYVEIIQSFPNFKNLDEVYFYLGTNLMEVGKRPAALDIFRRLIADYPKSQYVPNVLVAFGDYYFDASEMEQALKAYDKVTESYPNSAIYGYALYKKGWCQYNLDAKEKALDLMLQTLNFTKKRPDLPNSKPLNKQVRKDIVLIYAYVGQAPKAIPFFRKISEDNREEWLEMGERLAVFYGDQGKFEDAMAMYRELISLNKESVKTIDYQYEIVRAEQAKNAYTQESVKQQVILLKLVQFADQGKFKDKDDKRYPEMRAKVEELTRNWAITYHRDAQTTKNADLYAMAFHMYKNYLDTFTNTPQGYSMTFFYGELLYKLQQWEQAALAYERSLELDPKGQYTEDAVHGAVLAYFKVVDISEQAAKTKLNINEDEEKPDKKEGETPTKAEIPKPKEIPDIHKRLLKACERYVEHAPEGKQIVDVKYTMARIYYDFNHLTEAVKVFRDIAYTYGQSKEVKNQRIALISANLHLDSLNLLQRYEDLEAEVGNYLKERPVTDEAFLEETKGLYAQIRFKKCTIFDDKEEWKQASTCYVSFFRDFSDHELVDKALYNAALDFERQRDLGRAIQVRVFLIRARQESELVPKTLFDIGGNYHALAIYSRAAKFYELFVANFPADPKAEEALANASTFRQGMAQYGKAIENYEKYLDLFGKKNPDKAAEVFFQIAKIYETQKKKRQAFDQYTLYLAKWAKKGTNDRKLEAHIKLGLYWWEREGKTNRKKALEEFNRTLTEYKKLSEEQQKAMVSGRDAAAQSMFLIGEDVYQQMSAIQIDSKDERELQKRLKLKLDKLNESKKIFEDVIKFGRPDWAIAALYRIGSGMEDVANQIRKSRCPPRLNYDQCDIYKGLLEDNASKVEESAVSFYEKTLEVAKQANWFNKFTREAEGALSKLRPRQYRKPAEVRAEPDHVQEGFSRADFIVTTKEEDRLNDLGDGEGESSEEESMQQPEQPEQPEGAQ
jgi:cellulose synthase operon protein C